MLVRRLSRFLVFFFFNDTATTEIYTLSLHDAFRSPDLVGQAWKGKYRGQTQKWYALRFTGDEREIDVATPGGGRSEEHTSELQSQSNLVCRLLLEKKKHETGTTLPRLPIYSRHRHA